MNSKNLNESKEIKSIANSQSNYFELTLNQNDNLINNKLMSFKNDKKEIPSKIEFLNLNLKKEQINEILKESFIDIRPQCFAPSYINNITDTNQRKKSKKNLNKITDHKEKFLNESVLIL